MFVNFVFAYTVIKHVPAQGTGWHHFYIQSVSLFKNMNIMKQDQQTPDTQQKDNRIVNEDNRITNDQPKESILPNAGKEAPSKEEVDPEIKVPTTKPSTTEEERPTMQTPENKTGNRV
jgi:hypothetical protein